MYTGKAWCWDDNIRRRGHREEAEKNKVPADSVGSCQQPSKGPLLLAPVSLLALKLTKGLPWGIPWWCSGWDSMLSLPSAQRAWVQSLVGKIKFHKVCAWRAKKNQKTNTPNHLILQSPKDPRKSILRIRVLYWGMSAENIGDRNKS